MTENITAAELAKAAHNLGRLAEFVGVRRRWDIAEGGGSPAKNAHRASKAITELIREMTGGEISAPVGVAQPSELEPSGEVSADRLGKFADYLEQLRRWFEAHNGTDLPYESANHARSIQRSLAATVEALAEMLGGSASESESIQKPEKTAIDESEQLTRDDLGPVAKVDPNARLILDHTWEKSLLQKRDGILELTPDTTKRLDAFFSEQSFELNTHERRRLYEKVQRWVESTPNGRVLVLRMTGLSGKLDVLSSFQPKEEENEVPAVVPQAPVVEPQEPAVEPQEPAVEPQEPAVEPEPMDEERMKSLLEEYMANPPSGVVPATIAPPMMADSAKKKPPAKSPADED